MLRFCLWALFAVLFFSCLSEPDCIITASSDLKISFYKPTSDTARFIKFDRIEVLGTDSVFHVGDSVSSVALPIHTGSYQTTFRFFYENQEDSLRISYTRSTRVISPSCGGFNHYQDLEVLMHSFTSIKIVNSQLSTSGSPNLNIHL